MLTGRINLRVREAEIAGLSVSEYVRRPLSGKTIEKYFLIEVINLVYIIINGDGRREKST